MADHPNAAVEVPQLTSLAHAEELDAADPLSVYRDRFAIPVRPDGSDEVYLCGNSLGCMPRTVPDMLARECEAWAQRGVEGHLTGDTPWYACHELVRDGLARIVGAEPGEVVAMNSLTVNLHLMLVSFWRPVGRRRRILLERGAFPSDRYAVSSHVASRGEDPDDVVEILEPRAGEETLRTEDIEARLARDDAAEIALVLLGGVHFVTGEYLDLPAITRAAHAAGAMMGVDLAHAVGNVPLALHEWGVDFAVWCSYKYLNAGPGAVGGCFVHQRHGSNGALPRFAGWWGNDPATRFEMRDRFVPVPGADGWQLSNPPVLALAPLRASLALFDEVGMVALRTRSVRLTAALEHLVREMPSGRCQLLTPSDPERRGCQLSLRIPGGASAVFEGLRARGVLPDLRKPDVIRLAPVPLYNTLADCWRTAAALRTLLA